MGPYTTLCCLVLKMVSLFPPPPLPRLGLGLLFVCLFVVVVVFASGYTIRTVISSTYLSFALL